MNLQNEFGPVLAQIVTNLGEYRCLGAAGRGRIMSVRLTPNPLTRRRLLAGAGSSGLAFIAAPALLRHAAAQAWRAGDPFSLGVASGAPRSDGFVLWTRLAPDPLSNNPDTPGGMIGGDVTLGYEIAADAAMREIVRRGETAAQQAFAYSVHLDVRGLEPGRPYWYRFTSGDAASRIGRASTLPAPGAGLRAAALRLRVLLQL